MSAVRCEAVPPAPCGPHEAAGQQSLERACSVGRTINVLSDAWAFLILREAFFSVRTFEGFQAALKIPRATLSTRLSTLTQAGIFRKIPTNPSGRRLEYRLTRMGFDLYPSFVALMQFGDRWLSGEETRPLTLFHTSCGCECRPVVACSACGEQVVASDVAYRDGPGAGRVQGRPGRSARRSSDDAKFLVGRPCSVSRALQIIGDRWSFMVVRESFFGVRRYDQFQAKLGISPNILTDRLTRFVDNGILRKRTYSLAPPRHEYVLTEMGRDLYGSFLAMLAWGDRWLSRARVPLRLSHRVCGHDFEPTLSCDRCGGRIDASGIRYVTNYDPQVYGIGD